MTTSYGATPPGITGTHYGGSSLGVRGDLVPSTGLDGAGYLYAGLSLPADNAKEVRGPITRWPAGTLVVYEDSSFTYTGSTDYALFALYVDGVASATDIGYGAGIGRFDLNIGSSTLSGGVTLDAVAPAGTLAGGVSQVSGNCTLGAVDPSGVMYGGPVADLAQPIFSRSIGQGSDRRIGGNVSPQARRIGNDSPG